MRLMNLVMVSLLFAVAARADFTFVHVTDSHVSAGGALGNNAEIDAAAFREISALVPKPAFVVHTGDVCETATPHEYAIWRERVLKELSIPIHIAPGNHDVRWNPLGKEGYKLGTGQPLFHSWDYQNVHFVLLDPTVLLQHWGHFSQAQLDWLKADLEKVGPDKPVIIGFHHWVGRDTVQVDNEEELLNLTDHYNVVLWLQGHGHADIQWNINGAPAVMAKGLYQGSYHLIEVTGDKLTVRRRTLGKPSGNEILRDKSVPGTREVVWKELVSVPLAKQPKPEWSATSTVEPMAIAITATWPGPLTLAPKFDYQFDDAKYAELKIQSPAVATASIPTASLTPGNHHVTVRLTFPDGREYQKHLRVGVAGAVTPAWTANVGGAVQSHLVRAGDSLYVTTMAGDLRVLDAASGKERWRFTAADAIFSTPLVADGVVYFGSADHHVYAIDEKMHQPKWKYKTEGAVLAGPAVARGIVCIASVDQTIYGLDAATGEKRWAVKGNNMFQSNAASDGRRFYVGGWDNTLRAIDAASGQVAWTKTIGHDKNGKISFYYSPAISSPAIGDGKVYVTTNDGVLHAFACDSGEEAWSYDGKKLGYSGPLYHDGPNGPTVYCAIGDEGRVFALNARTGKERWAHTGLPVIYDSSFAFANGVVFIGSVDGTFNALDAATGQLRWQYRLGRGHVFASPATDDQRVYIGSLSGVVTALPVK